MESFRERFLRNFAQYRAPHSNLPRRVFCPVWVFGDVSLRFLSKSSKSCYFLNNFRLATYFFASPVFFGSLYCFMVFFCLRRDLHVFVFASVLLFASVFVFLFYGCFCLRLFLFSVLISFFSVFRFRAISTFFSGIRGPLERGARMAGTGGLVKRPNFDNASFA